MNHFCTITTASHWFKVQALTESLKAVNSDFKLHVLCIDEAIKEPQAVFNFYQTKDIKKLPVAESIESKYKSNKDKLRWCMKPVFMHHLLSQSEIDKLIYLDNDLFFYNEYSFLFDLLTKHSFLLTPHHYNNDPNANQNWLEANFRVGLFNAGFVGANKRALNSLNWWAECCNFRCEKNPMRGLFDDQKYLDLIPVMEKNALILHHKGCNVASWNIVKCPREMKSGRVYIDGEFPVVFIHFNNTCIRDIMDGKDPLLKDHLSQYVTTLKKFKPELTEKSLYKKMSRMDRIKYDIWKLATDWGF